MDQEQEQLNQLREVLDARFSETELRNLCFALSVDYEGLPGEGKSNKARELIGYLERRDRIPHLIMMGERQRPDIWWSHLLFDFELDIEWIGMGKAMELTGYSSEYLAELADRGWARARKAGRRKGDEPDTESWLFDRDVVWFHSRGWLGINEANVVTGYTVNYLRSLAREGVVSGRKIRRSWLLRRDILLDYCRSRGRSYVDTLPSPDKAVSAGNAAGETEQKPPADS